MIHLGFSLCSPDPGKIKNFKPRPAKLVSKSVKYQPEQQTAQTVSSAMMLPPVGSTSAIDNFSVSDSHNPSPEYPEMAVFLGYQGTAVIRIKVSAQGISKGVEILRSSGHKILDESAAKALKKCKPLWEGVDFWLELTGRSRPWAAGRDRPL